MVVVVVGGMVVEGVGVLSETLQTGRVGCWPGCWLLAGLAGLAAGRDGCWSGWLLAGLAAGRVGCWLGYCWLGWLLARLAAGRVGCWLG